MNYPESDDSIRLIYILANKKSPHQLTCIWTLYLSDDAMAQDQVLTGIPPPHHLKLHQIGAVL